MGKPIYHDATMVQLELRENENRSRARSAWSRGQAPVKAPSMIQYASREHIDSGRTAPQKYHSGIMVSQRWAA